MAVPALVTFAPWAHAQGDDRPGWSLKASTPSAELVGEWELSARSNGASTSEASRAAELAQPGVTLGSSFQLQVKLVDPNGAVTHITGSPKLIYRPQGCMAVGADGIATVLQTAAPPWTCTPGDPIPLTIIYADATNGIGAMNMYLFKIN